MELIPIEAEKQSKEYAQYLSEMLEKGSVLLLDPTPFRPLDDECAFLRAQKQADAKTHKNIAYKPNQEKLTGAQSEEAATAEQIKGIMARYSKGALEFMAHLLPGYALNWKVDYASYRPFEELGRDLPLSRRNDLMHIDAFPTRPTHGDRILRLFTNVSADRDRVWVTSDDFEELAARYAREAGLDKVTSVGAGLQRAGAQLSKLVGAVKDAPTAYDQFMMGFHHYLKANEDFQKNGRKHTLTFPPGASWLCFTDQIAHAVLSGQYAVEQTCIVSYKSLLLPELAPVNVLEKLAGKPLAPAREVQKI